MAILFAPTIATAQQKSAGFTLKGRVVDEGGRPIDLATVTLNGVLGTQTDRDGRYTLKNVPAGSYTYRVSFVGYQTATGRLDVKGDGQTLNVKLNETSLKLKGVSVTAHQVQMGSKSEIGQEAIRHLQPKTVGDLLQLMPGNLTVNPDLNQLSQAQIREIGSNANNALGTQVIVDGTPLSNNANLQVVSPTYSGSASSTMADGMSDQTTAGRGVDLRTVSAGNVESMEVIRGIPSVEYGNLTSGVVIVHTKSGRTPWEAKVQADPNSKLAFAGKGFDLRGGGALNFSFDWAQSWADTRRHYLGYDRITASAGYSNQWGALSFNAKGAFYSTVNNQKNDPQMLSRRTHYKNKNQGGRLSLNGAWKPAGAFITSLNYDASLQYARTLDKHDTWVSNPDGVVTTARESGVHVARLMNVGYQSYYQIEGKPINFYSQLVARKYMQLSASDYTNLMLGAEYTYDGNEGRGFTYNETYPPQAQGTQTLRPRPYRDVPGISTLSVFAGDKLALGLPLATRAQVEAGLRLSTLFVDEKKSGGHNNITVLEPRVNASFSLLNKQNNSWLDDLSLTGGFGISNKMPTLLYLYPDKAYFDNVSLSHYGTTEDARLALMTTDVVSQTANKHLKPARATKWELGLSFRQGQASGFITYFNEHHRNEYGFRSQLLWQHFERYAVPTDATALQYDETTRDVTYQLNGVTTTAARTAATEMYAWSRPDNTTRTVKHGIEYGLDLGELRPLHTSLSINGAWFHIKRTSEKTSLNYIMPNYAYVGIMPSGQGSLRDRVNTNFRFITHIPVIKMIFTTTVQCVWYESSQSIWQDNDGNDRFYRRAYTDKDYLVVEPLGYYDLNGQYTAWQSGDMDNDALARVAGRYQTYNFEKDVIDPWVMLNFRFTKELGKVGELSFIANNLTNTKRWHTNKHSLTRTQMYPDMYFGAELKLKF